MSQPNSFVPLRLAGLAVLVAALGLGSTAQALPIANWDVANATGQDATVLATAANVTASAIDEIGVSQWASTAQDGFVAASGWGADPNAYDPARYYQWTVTADPGYQVGYETFDLALFRGVWGGGHGAQKWDLRASTDGFASVDLALGSFDISASGADVQTAFLGHDISALGTQTGTVTFRLYGYDQSNAGDFSGLGNDDGTWLIFGTGVDPMIGGTVSAAGGPSVGEPPAALLALAGLLGLFASGSRPRGLFAGGSRPRGLLVGGSRPRQRA